MFASNLVNSLTKDNSNSLYLAASHGNLEAVRKLITYKENLNILNNAGLFALHSAIFNGHLEVATELINCNNIEDLKLANGRTVMHLVSECGYSDLLLKMLSKIPKVFIFKKSDDGITPLHLAVMNNHFKVVEILLKFIDKQLINLQTTSGTTAIHLVKDTEILDKLLASGANPNIVNNEAQDPLMIAIINCRVDIAMKLINFVILTNKNKDCWTAFQLSSKYGLFTISEAILKNKNSFNLASLDPSGYNYIHYLVKYGINRIALTYLKNYPNLIKTITKDGLSIVDLCFMYNNQEMITFLRHKNIIIDLDLRSVINKGPSYIEFAIINGMKSLVDEFLVISGRSSVEEFKNILSTACKYGRYEIFKSILDQTTNVENENINEFVNDSLHSKEFNLIKYFIINHKINSETLIFDDMTLPELASLYNNVNLLMQMRECGIKLDTVNLKSGEYPVYQSVKFNHKETFTFFLDFKNDLSIPEGLPSIITRFGRIEFLRDLLKNENNPIKNQEKIISLIEEAVSCSQYEMFIFLLSLVNDFDESFEVLLKKAMSCGKLEYSKLILERFGKFDMLQTTCFQPSPLDFNEILMNKSIGFITSKLIETDYTTLVPQKILSDDKITLLQLAIIIDNRSFIDHCFSKNLLINSKSLYGNTLFHISAFSNNVDSLCNLVSKFSPVLKKELNVNELNSNGFSAIHIAVAKGNLQLVQYLIYFGADANCEGQDGLTPLMLAVSGKKEEIVDYLILFPKVKNYKNKKKITPIYFSVLISEVSTIHKLLALNVEINSFYGENNETILHAAISTNKMEIIRLFFTKSFLNIPDNQGIYPIHKVFSLGDETILNYFRYHLSNESVSDSEGKCPLEYAIISEKDNFIKQLVNREKKYSCSNMIVEYNRKMSYKCFHFEAARKGNADLIKFFIENRFNLSQKDENGNDILVHAVRSGNKKLVEYLISSISLSLEVDKAFVYSAFHGHHNITKYMIEELNLPPDTRLSSIGETALSMAALAGSDKVLCQLLNAGAKVNIDAAIINAIKKGNVSCVRKLISSGVNIKHKDNQGNNLIWYAINNGRPNMVALFLLYGIDPQEKNHVNQTSFDIAICSDNLDSLIFLILSSSLKFSVQSRSPKIIGFIEKYFKTYNEFTKVLKENSLHLIIRMNILKPCFIKFAALSNDLQYKSNQGLNPFQLAISLNNKDMVLHLLKFYNDFIDYNTLKIAFIGNNQVILEIIVKEYVNNLKLNKEEILNLMDNSNDKQIFELILKNAGNVYIQEFILKEMEILNNKIIGLELKSYPTINLLTLLKPNSLLNKILEKYNSISLYLDNFSIKSITIYYLICYLLKTKKFKTKEKLENLSLGETKVITFIFIILVSKNYLIDEFISLLNNKYDSNKEIIDKVIIDCCVSFKSNNEENYLKITYDSIKQTSIFSKMKSETFENFFIYCNRLPLLRDQQNCYTKQSNLQRLSIKLQQKTIEKSQVMDYVATIFSQHEKGFLGIVWGGKNVMTRSQIYAYIFIYNYFNKGNPRNLTDLDNFINSLQKNNQSNLLNNSKTNIKYFNELCGNLNKIIESSGGQIYVLNELHPYLIKN